MKTKEHPILFSTEMIRAIFDGRKGMTRRVCIGARELSCAMDWPIDSCPYGQVGDRLWVRETWAVMHPYDKLSPREIPDTAVIWYKDTDVDEPTGCGDDMGKWRPSIFMPRWVSRIILEIVSIKVERLQDITEADAKNEGVSMDVWHGGKSEDLSQPAHDVRACYRTAFANLWDSINAKRGYGWDSNPWCWVLKFKRV